MKYKRGLAGAVSVALSVTIGIIASRVHGDAFSMVMPMLIAVVFPLHLLLGRFAHRTIDGWHTPKAWGYVVVLSALFALSGVLLCKVAGAAGTSLIVGDLICAFLYLFAVFCVYLRAYKVRS